MATIATLKDLEKAYNGYLSTLKKTGNYRTLVSISERTIPFPCVPLIEISENFNPKKILFVGFNPSGADTTSYSGNKKDVFIYRGKSSYYLAMESFAKECGYNEYSELDVLGLVRKTQSKVVKNFLNNPSLFSDMLDIFLDAIVGLKPSVIVVANAFIRKFLLRDVINVPKLKNPVFDAFYNRIKIFQIPGNLRYELSIDGRDPFPMYFSCMLSGQRAIDLGNRENLIWIVKNKP